MYGQLAVAGLGPGPRRVPFLLVLACFSLVGLGLALGGVLVGIAVYVQLDGHAGLYVAAAAAAVALWLFYHGRRRLLLLRRGEAVRAEIIERRPNQGVLTAFVFDCRDWHRACATRYEGPSSNQTLRVWNSSGRSATFKRRDQTVQQCIFLVDPQQPKRHSCLCPYRVSLRPDASGAWKVWPQVIKHVLPRGLVGLIAVAPAAYFLALSLGG